MLKVGCISMGFPNFRYDIAEQNLHKTLDFLNKRDIELIANTQTLITEEDIVAALDEMSGKISTYFCWSLAPTPMAVCL